MKLPNILSGDKKQDNPRTKHTPAETARVAHANNPKTDDASGGGNGNSISRYSWIAALFILIVIIGGLLFILVPQLRALWVPVANQIIWVDVLAAVALTGIYPFTYLAYLGFGADAQRKRLRADFRLFGLVSDDELDETINNLYQNVYSWPQFLTYIVLIMAFSLLVVLAYLERERVGIVGPGIMEVIFFGYLGAYVFSVQELVRRYNTFDLQPQVYSSILVRILVAVAITFVISSLGVDWSAASTQEAGEGVQYTASSWMLLVAFVVGIFPNSGIRWLTAQANRVINQSSGRRNELPVRNLLGISTWHEARLSMMGIDDAQNLATADIPRMLLTTQFDTQQVANWIDQAILYVKIGDKIERFRESKVATFSEFIRTVGELDLCAITQKDNETASRANDMRSSLATVLGLTDPNELVRLSNYVNYPNFNHIYHYYQGKREVGSQLAQRSVQQLTGAVLSDRDWIQALGGDQGDDLEKELKKVNTQIYGSFNNPELLSRRGVILFQMEEFEQAKADFDQALELDKEFTDAYYGRSFVHLEEGDTVNAILDVTKAIDLNPTYAEAYNHRGSIYLRMGTYDRAIVDLDRALDLDHRLAVAHYNLGVAYSSLGRLEEAIDEFEKAYLLGYEQVGLWSYWGLALVGENKFELAIDRFTDAIRHGAQQAGLYASRANAYMQLGEGYYSQARFDLEVAQELDGTQFEVQNQFGNLEAREGNFEAAVSHYQLALLRKPDSFSVRIALANAFQQLREHEQAVEQFQRLNRIARLGDLSAAQVTQLGSLAERLGLSEATRADLIETLELNTSLGNKSGQALTLRQLGTFHFQRGEYNLSKDYWLKACALYDELGLSEEAAAVQQDLDSLESRFQTPSSGTESGEA